MSVSLQRKHQSDFSVHNPSQEEMRQKLFLKPIIRSYVGQDAKRITEQMFEKIVEQYSPRVAKSRVQAVFYPHLLETLINRICTLFMKEDVTGSRPLVQAAEYALVAYTDNGVGFPVFARSEAYFDKGSHTLKKLYEKFNDIVETHAQEIEKELCAVGQQLSTAL